MFVIIVVLVRAGVRHINLGLIQISIGAVSVRNVSGAAAKRRQMEVTKGQARGPVKTAAIGPRAEKGAAYKHKRQSHP